MIAPFADRLQGLKWLAIASDSWVDNVPFAALVADDSRFLVEQLPLSRVTSLFLQQRLIATPHLPPSGALVVDLQQFGDRVWVPSIYHSVLSAEAIHEWLPAYRLADLALLKNPATVQLGRLVACQSWSVTALVSV